MKLQLKYKTYFESIKETLIEFDIYKPLDDRLILQAVQHQMMVDSLFEEYQSLEITDIKSRNEIDNLMVRHQKLHNTVLDKLNITPYQRAKLDILQTPEEDPFTKIASLMAS